MNAFEPCSESVFFKSTKEKDPRLGEMLSNSPSDEAFFIAGYPDDEGIKLNQGRLGARQAPDCIRKYFYKMAPAVWQDRTMELVDVGNLKTEKPIEQRHDQVVQLIVESLSNKPSRTWIGLGGGHDYSYPDGAGFLKSLGETKHKPLIINFDAHLDVRSTSHGLSSGTGFYRLMMDKSLPEFDFVEIGIQSHCNSQHHYNWLKEQGGHILDMDDILLKGLYTSCTEFLEPWLISPRPTYLSIDIDAFASAYAPGCSQSWSTGLIPNDFMPLLQTLKKRLDIRLLGIYEVSPPLDSDDHTSKLAAQLMHSFIY